MLETLDCAIRIGSTPTFLYFNWDIYGLQRRKASTKKYKDSKEIPNATRYNKSDIV